MIARLPRYKSASLPETQAWALTKDDDGEDLILINEALDADERKAALKAAYRSVRRSRGPAAGLLLLISGAAAWAGEQVRGWVRAPIGSAITASALTAGLLYGVGEIRGQDPPVAQPPAVTIQVTPPPTPSSTTRAPSPRPTPKRSKRRIEPPATPPPPPTRLVIAAPPPTRADRPDRMTPSATPKKTRRPTPRPSAPTPTQPEGGSDVGPAEPTQPPSTATPPPADDDGPSEPTPDTPTADTPTAQPGCDGIGLDGGVGDLVDLDVCLLG